jgi:uncharacterized protein (TIGR02145 family)
MKTMNKLSKIVSATLLIFTFTLSTLFAQNDTMYIMKAGVVVGQYNVNTEIDSIIFYNADTSSTGNPCPGTPTVTDYDGNTYNTVQIGNQCWMKENLKTTHYSNGTAILLVDNVTSWGALTQTDKAYCWYDDDSVTNASQYGALYTWAAAMNGAASSTANPSGIQGVCPTGWHLSSDAEWTQMENYLADNGYNYDGTTGGGRDKIAKSMADSSGWTSSSYTGSVGNTDYRAYRNKSGFTALPGGYRDNGGTFFNIGYYGGWWSATESDATNAWYRYMSYDYSYVYRYFSSKEVGFSVRCLRD